MPRTRHIPLLPALLLATACGGGSGSPPAVAPAPPPAPTLAVRLEPVFASLSFSQPVAAAQAPADPGRWFVVEKAGVVRVFDNDPQTTASNVFVDLRGRVSSSDPEAGLLGLAFHPDFASNGQVFVSYTRSGSPLESVVARLTSFDGGATLDAGSEQILLTVLQDFTNHNGGHLAFGPDGNLYAGFGDGGSGDDPLNRAQNDSTLLGKIIRIDVDGGTPYAIPADNPFAGNANCVQGFGGAPCPEIYASGLRNPWRFSFDRDNGNLWAGDVGQSAFEEIDLITLGGNYGWRIREGASCNIPASGCATAGLTDPVHAYGRGDGVSVTGGYVYRGSGIPLLAGRYVFGDFGSGRIWSMPADASGGSDVVEMLDSALSISSFAEGADGDLLVIDYSGGALFQIVDGN